MEMIVQPNQSSEMDALGSIASELHKCAPSMQAGICRSLLAALGILAVAVRRIDSSGCRAGGGSACNPEQFASMEELLPRPVARSAMPGFGWNKREFQAAWIR